MAAACAVGAALALIVFSWFALEGRADPFGRQVLSNFYEVQARSLVHGHWDVPSGSLLFERFRVGTRYYTYFGPWPSLLRLPVVAVTHRLDGRLGRLSMIVAFAVMLAAIARLVWQARVLVRGDDPPTRATLVASAGFVFVAGCGSTALFLGSVTWVYHEAILWGIAWALVSYTCLIAYLREPSRRSLVLTSITATFAYLSRASVGSGPVIALVLILAWRVLARVRTARRSGADAAGDERGRGTGTRAIWALAVATVVPLALYAYVNYERFGTFFGLPPERQDLLTANPARKAALAANGGTLFGVKYAPTILLQYLRPDAIGFDRLFPWVTFSSRPRAIGDVVFESINFSASTPATSPLLVLLALIGLGVIIAALRNRDPTHAAGLLAVPVVAAGAACAGTFVLAFLDERYEADFVPALVLAGAVGLWWVPRRLAALGRGGRRAVAVLVVLAGAWSCWATGSLTLLYQRAYAPFVAMGSRASVVDFQLDVHDAVPGGLPPRVRHRDGLPLPRDAGPQQSLLVIGDCAGLYWSNGRDWYPLEQTAATGKFRLSVRVAGAPIGMLEPLLAAHDARGSSILWLRRLGDGRIQFEYQWTGSNRTFPDRAVTPDAAVFGPRVSAPVIGADGITITARFDQAGYVSVRAGDRLLMSVYAPVAHAPATVGRQRISDAGASRFAGEIHQLPTPTPICDRLTKR